MSNGNMPIGVKGRIRNPDSESCRAIDDRFWPISACHEGHKTTHSCRSASAEIGRFLQIITDGIHRFLKDRGHAVMQGDGAKYSQLASRPFPFLSLQNINWPCVNRRHSLGIGSADSSLRIIDLCCWQWSLSIGSLLQQKSKDPP